MDRTRRRVLGISAGAAAFAVTSLRTGASQATPEETARKIAEFAGGMVPKFGRVALAIPEIAENGYSVAITVSVESAMAGDDLVESVMILADGNPNAEVATFHFTELSGSAFVASRIRLAKTQNVIAVARMKDGSTFMDSKEIKVTIGGCG